MVFTSTIFLFAVPARSPLLAFYAAPRSMAGRARCCVTSAVFYAWGEPVLVVLILLTGAVHVHLGAPARGRARSRELAPPCWSAGSSSILVPIAIFKYLDFALAQSSGWRRLARRTHLPLPIGVSFYTFMAVGYLIDIYRRRDDGRTRAAGASAGFLTMFPHLVAGPIVRWYDIGPQLAAPRFDPGLFGYGALRVAGGLAKKAVLADSLAVIVDRHVRAPARRDVARARRGWPRCCTACRSTWTSRRTPTSRSGWRPCSACGSTRTSASRTSPRRPASSGSAGTSRSARGSATTSTSRSAARGSGR